MNEPSKHSPYGVGLLVLFLSWFFFPVAFIVSMCLPFHKLSDSSMGIIYQAYGVSAIYFSVFCSLSIIKYQHPHWVRIVYVMGMLSWCCGFHFVYIDALGAC